MAAVFLSRLQTKAAEAGHLDPFSFFVRSGVNVIASPMNSAFDTASDVTRRLREGDRLAQENEMLRSRLSALSLYDERISLLEGEVENLRGLAQLSPLPGHERVMADVVAFAQYEGQITLSVGSEKGIARNMPVISSDGLVAIVQTVWNGGCRAAHITNVGVQVGVLDLSRQPPTEGILKGRDPTTLVLTFFDSNAPAKLGDIVVTSGHSDRIPRLLRVGKIISVEDDVDYGIRRATIVPFMNPGELKEVQILR